jgi:pyruvate/2-oxoglutarate dehydrogenase complex dihydrolipoamide acyltransferase (E2) component
MLHWFLRLPQLVRDIVYWFFWHIPTLWKQQGGTVGVTSVGMFTRGGAWGIPITNYSLHVCIGGIAAKPAFVGDVVMKREFVDITICINHDVVDGGPAARFLGTFRNLVESGLLLPEPAASV